MDRAKFERNDRAEEEEEEEASRNGSILWMTLRNLM